MSSVVHKLNRMSSKVCVFVPEVHQGLLSY